MKTALKLFSGLVLGAFAFVLALSAPGTGSAEAYVDYSKNSKSNYKNYSQNYNSNSYKSSNSTYKKYNYNYKNTNTGNYKAYNPYNGGYKKQSANTPNYKTPNYKTPSYKPSQPAYNPGRTSQPSGGVNSADEQAMLNMINRERAAKGLKPLAMDSKLTQVARTKAKDMVDNNYFSHNSPTHGSPFDMMKKNGITYRHAGENLAGAPDVNTAHQNLMKSPGHRANILKPEYTKVGIGVVSGGPYGKMYVQEFNG